MAKIVEEIDLVRTSLNGGAAPCGLVYVHSRQVHFFSSQCAQKTILRICVYVYVCVCVGVHGRAS